MIAPAVIEWRIEAFALCTCPTCQRLDKRFPNEGRQLALFPYEISLPPAPGTGLQHVLTS